MKEINDILIAYRAAEKSGLRSALATVVQLEGSSYRRPGARMLITEDGKLTGAISGGCLEGDAMRKALSAIVQQENKLITYDTTDEDDAKIGVQLGCNGIVHILFEPIKAGSDDNPIELLKLVAEARENVVVVTLFSLESKVQSGTSLIVKKEKTVSRLPDPVSQQISLSAATSLEHEQSTFADYQFDDMPCTAFFEFISPPIALVIVGAGNDAQPLSKMANILGWNITIADGRPTHSTSERFSEADAVLIVKPDQLLSKVNMDERTAFVLMTHNYNYDLAVLKYLIATNAAYIGTLGPKKKLVRMLEELGLSTRDNLDRVHGPVGLDLGAETAEEIALSILAEIKAVFSGTSAKSLKNKSGSVHGNGGMAV